ncbi:MAG: M23 family metallopeptidase [Flavobacteriaceae bacterium]|nr:M23 family metallopeptidase [Flavobacteriaceae bacterium]
MKNEKDRKATGLKKLFNQYRIVVIGEDTFEEKLYFRLSIINIILASFLAISFIATMTYFIIAYSPVREFIPGYPSTKMRIEAISNAIKIDSITSKIEKQQVYFEAIKRALSGEIKVEEISIQVSEKKEQIISFPPKTSKEDSILRAIVAEEDKYNVINDNSDSPLFILFTPAKGIVSEKFNIQEKHFAVDVALEENTPIKSIAEGTVIFSEWTAETGYVIILKHPYELISVYKHNASLTKQQGENVQAGEVIASAGNTGEFSTGFHLHFELWAEGYPIDPEKLIDFSK